MVAKLVFPPINGVRETIEVDSLTWEQAQNIVRQKLAGRFGGKEVVIKHEDGKRVKLSEFPLTSGTYYVEVLTAGA